MKPQIEFKNKTSAVKVFKAWADVEAAKRNRKIARMEFRHKK